MSTQPTDIRTSSSQNPLLIQTIGINLPGRDLKLEAFHDRLRRALADPAAKIYIDTSLLMWLLKVSATARREFLDWCNDPSRASRICVTTWCAHELYRHLKDESVLQQIRERVESQREALDDVVRFADQAYDDTLCANTEYATKAAAIEGLRKSVGSVSKNLNRFLTDSMRSAYSIAETQIRQFVNAHTIWTDAINIVADIKPEYCNRSEGRVPPGYHDDDKGKNSFGDFVFWREVLSHSDSAPVIILTNDSKTDWVHTVTKIENYRGKELSRMPKAGVEIQLPHPFLAFEANQMGVSQLEVINIGNLALFLEKESPRTANQLVAAAYPRNIEEGPFPSWTALGIPRPPETSVMDLSLIDLLSLNKVSKSPELGAVLKLLRGEREDVSKVIPSEIFPSLLPTLDSAETAQLGRAFVRAVIRFPAHHSFADLLQVAGSSNGDSRSALYVGMLLGAYLKGNRLRRTPDGSVAQAVFALADEPYALPALTRVDEVLQAADAFLVARPTQSAESLPISFAFRNEIDTPPSISSILVNSIELFDEAAGENRKLSTLMPANSCTIDELTRLIAREFAIPFKALHTDSAADRLITWANEAGIATLRTDLGKVATDIDLLIEGSTND